MKKINAISCFILGLVLIVCSCEKGPGEGGNSSIYGYISLIKYNAFFTDTIAIYDGRDEDVYIIYGDDIGYGDRIRSGYDGKFEFKYLREGNYKIYVYSDTLKSVADSIGKVVVMKELEITEKNQNIDAGIFEIRKN